MDMSSLPSANDAGASRAVRHPLKTVNTMLLQLGILLILCVPTFPIWFFALVFFFTLLVESLNLFGLLHERCGIDLRKRPCLGVALLFPWAVLAGPIAAALFPPPGGQSSGPAAAPAGAGSERSRLAKAAAITPVGNVRV